MKYLIISSLLLIASCSDKEELSAPDLRVQQISADDLKISVDNATALADGTATIKATLEAKANVVARYSNIIFSITPVGRFVNGDTVYSTVLDVSGHANALVRSSGQEGTAVIKATIGGYTVQSIVAFTRPPLTDTLNLSIITDNVPADNYSYAHLHVAATNSDVLLKMKTITFQTDKGSFANGQTSYTMNAGLNGLADAYLRHSKAERAAVTATIAGAYTRQASVNFVQAWPNTLTIDPAAGTLARVPGTTLGITARLTRSYGTPTEGAKVIFRDSAASTGGSVGTFLATTASNTSGQVATTYSLQDTSFSRGGYIYLIGTVDTGGGIIRGINKIWVQ